MLPGIRSLVLVLLSLGFFSVAAAWQAKNREPGGDRIDLLRESKPRFWKGNLHTHSFWSDGDDFPEMIADWYRTHQYDFLTLSDHNVLSEGTRWVDITPARQTAVKKYLGRFGPAWVERRQQKDKEQVRLKPLREFRSLLEEPGRFLLIPGEEITHRFAKSPVHMNGINLRDLVLPTSGDSVAETIRVNQRVVAEQGQKTGWPNVLFLNHPNFGWGVRAEDLAAVEELRFFEVFNGHPGVNNYGDKSRPGCERMWDIALSLRLGKHRLPALHGLATDDAHGYHVFGVGKVNPGRGWIMVRAPYLSAEAIVRGMEAGDFYASTGVVLDDVRRSAQELALKIRPESGVKYHTQFIATKKGADLNAEPQKDSTGNYSKEIGVVVAESDSLEPSYRLTGQELYVRAKVTSTKPHPNPFQKGDVEVAWTQPALP
jgi:hypothetical protein